MLTPSVAPSRPRGRARGAPHAPFVRVAHVARVAFLASTVAIGPGATTRAAAQEPPVFPARIHQVGTGHAVGVAVGDVNGDGLPDAVVGKTYAASLAVLLGTGAGHFGPPTEIPSHDDPLRPVLADLDGDGELDIVVADATGTRTSVHLGDGMGGFGPRVDVLSGPRPWTALVADLDGDSLPDVASGHEDGMVRFALSVGPGTFGAQHALAVGGRPTDVQSADLDGDGIADLVVADAVGMRVVTLRGRGAGAFEPPAGIAVPHRPDALAVTDLDGDGAPDVLTGGATGSFGTTSGSVCFLSNDGGGTLRSAACWTDVASSSPALVTGDLDGDGTPEVVAVAKPQPIVFVAGPGGPAPMAAPETVALSGSDLVALHDVDGDGRLDVLHGREGLVVTRGAATGRFAVQRQIPVSHAMERLAVGDVDADGRLDVVAVHADADHVAVLLGNALGGFGSALPHAIPTGATAVALGDFDGDGDDDLAVGMDNPAFQAHDRVWVFASDGTGGFGEPLKKSMGGRPEMIDFVDLDGDGDLDMVAPLTHSGALSIRLGTGAGNFFPQTIYPSGGKSVWVAHGDLDEDGIDDLVAVGGASGFRVLLADGLGGVGAPVSYTDGITAAVRVALGDLDEDGHLDVVIAGAGVAGLASALGDGTGGFGPVTSWPTPSGPTLYPVGSVAVADVDGDGHLDVVRGGDAEVRRGDGQGHFGEVERSSVLTDAMDARLVDLDTDGTPEALMTMANLPLLAVSPGLLGPGAAPWTDLGHALPGASGDPVLAPSGTLDPGSAVSIALFHAAPSAPALLVLSAGLAPVPFHEGVLVAHPPLLQLPLTTTAGGTISVSGTWPALVPPGTRFGLQALVLDAGAAGGVALSNAVEAITP